MDRKKTVTILGITIPSTIALALIVFLIILAVSKPFCSALPGVPCLLGR